MNSLTHSQNIMNFKSRLFSVLAVVSSCWLLPSCSNNKVPLLTHADANGDSRVSGAEFRSTVQNGAFGAIDDDGNGRVTMIEWMAHEDIRDPKQRFVSLDKDRDGALTLLEFCGGAKKKSTLDNLFSTYDENDDGFLSRDEF